MKYSIIFFYLLFFFGKAFAQAPIIEWEKSLGGSDHEYARKIQQTADGGFILSGITFSTNGDVTNNHGIYDAWLVKLRADKSIEWQKTFGGSSDDGGYYVGQTADKGFIMGGFTKSTDGDVPKQQGISDAWFIKTDAAGTVQWNKTYGGTDYEVMSVIRQTPDGGYIAAGYSMSGNGDVTQPVKSGQQDWWLIKMDANGNKQWDKSYGGSDDEVAYALDLAPGGGYIVSGTSRSNDGQVTNAKGNYDIWTVRLNDAGAILWQKTFGGSGHEQSHSVLATADGGFLVTGSTQSADGDLNGNEGELDAVVVKYDAAGNLLWHQRMGGNRLDNFNNAIEKNGKYLVAGSTESTAGSIKTQYGKSDVLLAQFSNTGAVEWTALYGGSEIDDAFDIALTTDGGLILAASSFSNNNDVKSSIGGGDIWVVKLKDPVLFPVIDVQPMFMAQCLGGTATFTITASRANTYQWQILINGLWQTLTDNAKYTGSKTRKLDILNAELSDAHQYRCVVKNNVGETISNPAALIVNQKPTVSITPLTSSVCTGIAITFITNATDATTYNWQKNVGNNWQNTGKTGANYEIAAATLADIGEYRCVVDNNCGSAISNTTILDVTECQLPIINAEPTDATVCASGTAIFAINAIRTDNYQWQMIEAGNWQPLTNNEKYSGAQSERLEVKDVELGDGKQFRCVLKNIFGETISATVQLTVKEKPTIVTSSENGTVCVGATAKFTANATGANQFNWQKSNGNTWQNVGGLDDNFSITAANFTNSGEYRCIAGNDCGSTASNTILLTVADCSIPNAFSPNGDGINDKWAVYFLQNQPESSVRIFNRDGAQVFESQKGYPVFWDGTCKGKALPVGVYYYLISAKNIGLVKGSLTLIK